MRLMSFEIDGRSSFGLVADGGVIDAGRRLGGELTSLRAVLVAGEIERLHALAAEGPDRSLDEITFLPVIPDPAAKVLCVGINYMPHIEEMGRERPEYPVLFVRFGDSIVGHRQPLIRPRVSEHFDYEGELAVIIGKRARHVAREQALAHVAGFSCFNDGSVRDYQRHSQQWTPGKNFHASGSFGPWMVTADEQPNPGAFHLKTRLNGDVLQDASVE